jgi:uncharacterized protein (TIGR02453 family)
MNQTPAFPGFPPEALHFLRELAANNNREWFQAHKDDYLQYVLEPAQHYTLALGERLREISAGITYDTRTNGSGSILRIYRDTRFSKDKTPYNTHLRVVFWEGARKKMENPSFFVRMDPAGVGLYTGLHRFPKPVLAAYRDAVVDPELGADLSDALAAVRAAGDYTVGGEHYKRVPRGYDADHPRADLLRHDGLYAHATVAGPEVITTPSLVDACFEHLRNLAPLHLWLVRLDRWSEEREVVR